MFHQRLSYEDETETLLLGQNSVSKIIALWAFSEATLGGILHAFNVPFTGLFVGGVAVLLISLIASKPNNNNGVIKATLIVLTVKGMVSPHTPLTAYGAVLLQGLIAQFLFTFIKQKRIAALIFGISAMLLSAFQKIIILTVIFGNTLWESINIYSSFIINQFLLPGNNPDIYNLSFLLIVLYIGIHLLAGIASGYIAGKLPLWIEHEKNSSKVKSILSELEEIINNTKSKSKKKSWWRKKSGIVFITTMIIILGFSYLFPEFGSDNVSQIIIMLVRSSLIMIIWFFLLSPFLLKYFRYYLSKQQKSYSSEINQIINLFPYIKGIIRNSWDYSKEFRNLKRLQIFLSTVVVLILLTE